MIKQKHAFTLVELIVVIAIKAILSTIAFISLQWYSTYARDSVRVTDINSLMKALELYKVDNWDYPVPDNSTNIVYSWSTVWSQLVIGESVTKGFISISDILLDPLTSTPYTYSITNQKDEYQIGSIMENSILSFNNLNTVNAADTKYDAYVVWNYNWKFTKLKSWNVTYVFDTPSILAYDISNPDIVNIYKNKKFVFNWFNNIPSSYSWTNILMNWWFNYWWGDPVKHSWTISSLSDLATLKTFTQAYKNSIAGSDLINTEPYKSIWSLNLADSHSVVATMIPMVNNTLSTNIDPYTYVYPPNEPPVAPTIADITITENELITPITLSGFTDTDTLTYSMSWLTAWLSFNASTREITWTVAWPNWDWTSTITYTANDWTNNPVSTTFNLIVLNDPWTWNSAHTLACKRVWITSITCKWDIADIDLSNLSNYNYQIVAFINGHNCQGTSNNITLYDINNKQFTMVWDYSNWCWSYISISSVNKIYMKYYDTWWVQKSTNTSLVNLNLWLIDINKDLYYKLHPSWFDFDFTNLWMDIDLDYWFTVDSLDSTSPWTYTVCNNSYLANNKTWSVNYVTNENCAWQFWIPNNTTDLVLVNKSNNNVISNKKSIVLPKFKINDTDYNLTSTWIIFNFSWNTEYSWIIKNWNNNIALYIDWKFCLQSKVNIFDTSSCSWLLPPLNTGNNMIVTLKYWAYGGFNFTSEPITVTVP